MGQCRAIVDGHRCRAQAIKGSEFCWFHRKLDAPATLLPDSVHGAVLDDRIFGRFFHPAESWLPWMVAWSVIYGIPLDDPDDLALFSKCTGRKTPREGGYDEAYLICGRRSGKSKTAALLASYEALFGGWDEKVGTGEPFYVFCVATDRNQASIVFRYIRSMLGQFPERVVRETADELWLDNGAIVAVKTANYRALRGWTVAFAVLDELAFFRDERSANPAGEIITAILPAMLPGAKLLGITSPFAKFGLVYDVYKQDFGLDTDRLVWKAETRTMNPTYRQSTVDRLLKKDRVLYSSEYLGEFREDIESFIPEALVELYCVGAVNGPRPGVHYTAFIDPSGGRQDSFTLAVAHVENEKVVLDYITETTPPFVPSDVVTEYASVLNHYGVREVVSDKYAGLWVQDAFKKRNIAVVFSDLNASDIYLEFQPRLSSGQCVMLNDEKLKLQLRQLERRPQPGGRDKVDSPQLAGFHDDVSNAAAGAVVYAIRGLRDPWNEAEQEAHLPQIHGGMPDRLRLPVARFTRTYQSAQQEMDEWFAEEPGVGKPVHRG